MQLVILRALQGFLGGAMIPIAYALSFGLFPKRVMGAVQAVMGMIATTAPTIGPTLGGWLTQHASWHWLFLINVIPGVISTIGVWRLLDIDIPDFSVFRRIDFYGLALMGVFLCSLEYLLEEGPGDDWFASRVITAAAFVSCVAGVLFFIRTLRAEHPIVDLRVFRNRNFAMGAGLGFLVGIAIYGFVYIMPLYLGMIRGFNSAQIGRVMLVTGVAMLCTAPVAGRASDKLDPRIMLAIGLALVGASGVMNGFMTDDWGYNQFFWPLAVRGVGTVFCMIPITRIALGTLPATEMGNASGLFNVLRNLGGAFGLAGIDTVRDMRFDYHWSQIMPSIDTACTMVVERLHMLQGLLGGHATNAAAGTIAVLAHTIAVQAQTLAFDDIYLWLGAMYLVVVPFMLFLRKRSYEPIAEH